MEQIHATYSAGWYRVINICSYSIHGWWMVWVWKLRGSGTSDGHGFRLKDNISQHHNGPDPSQILMVLFRVLVCVQCVGCFWSWCFFFFFGLLNVFEYPLLYVFLPVQVTRLFVWICSNFDEKWDGKILHHSVRERQSSCVSSIVCCRTYIYILLITNWSVASSNQFPGSFCPREIHWNMLFWPPGL